MKMTDLNIANHTNIITLMRFLKMKRRMIAVCQTPNSSNVFAYSENHTHVYSVVLKEFDLIFKGQGSDHLLSLLIHIEQNGIKVYHIHKIYIILAMFNLNSMPTEWVVYNADIYKKAVL